MSWWKLLFFLLFLFHHHHHNHHHQLTKKNWNEMFSEILTIHSYETRVYHFFCCPHKNDVTDFVFVFVFRFCCFQWIYTWFFVRWNMFSIFFLFFFSNNIVTTESFFSVLFFCFKNRKFLCEFFFLRITFHWRNETNKQKNTNVSIIFLHFFQMCSLFCFYFCYFFLFVGVRNKNSCHW